MNANTSFRTACIVIVAMTVIVVTETASHAQSCTYQRWRTRLVANPQCMSPVNCATPGCCHAEPEFGCTWGCQTSGVGGHCMKEGGGFPGGWTNNNGNACSSIKETTKDTYSCDTDERIALGAFAPLANNQTGNYCSCGPQPSQAMEITDDSIVPGTYNCDVCATSTGSTNEPELCNGSDKDESPPFDEGCGSSEFCPAAPDGDRSPIRYSSGRVETNPIVLYSAPSPEGLPFEYRIIWGSHVQRTSASPGNGFNDPVPTIHSSDEDTHFIGTRWLDNFSDRLYVNVFGKPSTTITWQSQNGTVTFSYSASTGWKSWSGRYELIDRCALPSSCSTGLLGEKNPSDGVGRWIVRTTDSSAPRQMWAFEEFPYTSYGGAQYVYMLGRLRRRALMTSDLSNVAGRYNYTVDWSTAGTITRAFDTLGRELVFTYFAPPPVGGKTYQRSLRTIEYRAPGGSLQPVAELFTDASNTVLSRVVRVGQAWYTRFVYKAFPIDTDCTNCGALLASVVVPGPGSPLDGSGQPIAPDELKPVQPWEIEIEGHEYGPSPAAPEIMVGVEGRSPGRRYGYQWATNSVTQFDLKLAGGTCSSGCASDYSCWTDGQCYVANVYTNDGHRLPTGMTAASGSSSQTFSRLFDNIGRPKRVTDASNTRTTYGYDDHGRVRCMVRGDGDDEAFADPGSPNTSACAGPTGSQSFQTDYTSNSITKTFPSLLNGNVTDTQTLNSTSLLLTSSSTVGKSRDIDGNTVTVTRTTTHSYDAIGRETETNGPLDDSVALDKSTTTYYASYDPSWPNNFGRVHQTSVYVGTASSNYALTTTYGEYDLWGVPHRVTLPNGDKVIATPSANRLEWTTVHQSADGTLGSSTFVQLNTDGTVRSVTDADGVCVTYEYTDATGFVGAVTRMRRSVFTDGCGVLPINVSSGEVELRTYMNGDPDRLQSVTRQVSGVVTYSYSGFTYDRDRKLTSLTTLDSPSPFALGYTDSLQTGVTAPSAPAAGTWQTDTTVDAFARATSFQRFLGGGNKQVFNFGYSSSLSPRPTTLTRGLNGVAASTTNFVYDDFAQLVETTVPESGVPGAPAPTRYEYDVGGRMIKKRQGTGTSSVRTDVYTYDSLGRTLTVDNDTEHPINGCMGSQYYGVAVEDFEYKYDSCVGDAPYLGPSGGYFTCNNALGRLTLARTAVQCAGFGSLYKLGRWYDYDKLGRTARVAYSGSTRSTYPGANIIEYSYTAAGRVQQYTSPLNSAFGTKYSYGASTGQVSALETSASTPSPIMSNMAYLPFGPLVQADTASLQISGGSVRKLQYSAVYRSDYALSGQSWKYVHSSGPSVPDIALIAQDNIGRTPAGAISTRYDAADVAASRFYDYDALLRLTCEARGSGSTNPTASDCVTSSTRLASLITYNDGADAAHPVDTRATSFTRTESGSYVSPALELSSYLGGSSQLQSINRGASTMVIAHDGLGRRTYEYDSIDPVRSRRDYTYTPNGQLDTIVGRTPSNAVYSYSFRYDDRGRPIKIATSLDGYNGDYYDLYWDDADRLLAASILMPACRGTTTPGDLYCSVGYRTASWHYHYLGSQLVAATHQLGSQTYRYWAAADERGLIHRMLDQNGGTAWQTRWDANGSRTADSFLGSGSIDEMWVPFGLPGQVILGTMPIAQQVGGGGPTSNPGAEAYASGPGWTWTRPAIALNRQRAYDPHVGAFLQPDGADQSGRLLPEGMSAFRNNSLVYVDPSGEDSVTDPADYVFGLQLGPYNFDQTSCNMSQRQAIITATGRAYRKLVNCHVGMCSNETLKQNLMHRLTKAVVQCNSDGLHYVSEPTTHLMVDRWGSGKVASAETWYTDEVDKMFGRSHGPLPGRRVTTYGFGPVVDAIRYLNRDSCLAETVAHEAGHDVISRVGGWVSQMHRGYSFGLFETPGVGVNAWRDRWDTVQEEAVVTEQIHRCLICE